MAGEKHNYVLEIADGIGKGTSIVSPVYSYSFDTLQNSGRSSSNDGRNAPGPRSMNVTRAYDQYSTILMQYSTNGHSFAKVTLIDVSMVGKTVFRRLVFTLENAMISNYASIPHAPANKDDPPVYESLTFVFDKISLIQ